MTGRPPTNPRSARGSRPTARPHRKPAPGVSTPEQVPQRFNSKLQLRFSAGEKTRQFSLRTLMVAIFIALAVVIVYGPLNQYLAQQQQKRALELQIAETTTRVEALEQEIARWQDPDFVRSQARERLGFVLPGETLYLVSDPEKGTAEQIVAERAQEVIDRRRAVTPFYITLWDSIQIAGSIGADNPSNVPLLTPNTTGEADPAEEAQPEQTGEADQDAQPDSEAE